MNHQNANIRLDALYTLYYLCPKTIQGDLEDEIRSYKTKVLEEILTNEDSAVYLGKFFDNENVSEIHKIVFYLLDGLCQFKESYEILFKSIEYV